MTEPVTPVTPADNQGGGAGADPKQNEKSGAPDVQDTKSGEKAFDESVFDDPRLWTHPRFKSLNERAKKAEMLEKAQAEAEEKRLADAKKFEELATKRAQERDEIQSKYTSQLQNNRIITEASKIGVVDIDTVLQLVDRAAITVNDDGSVSGVEQALQALLAAKPFLKGKSNQAPIGSPSSPSDDANSDVKTFKLSQLQNPTFYREHEKEIEKAMLAGKIEDDLTK